MDKKIAMPHPLDRLYQQQVYDLAMASDSKFVIIKMSTGSGKSAIPAQAGYDGHKVMVLTETISLQTQYVDSYDFKMVKGKSHYICSDDYLSYADICHAGNYPKEFCQRNCSYLLDKQALLDSNHASLNYSKFLLELREFGIVNRYSPSLLVCDEAHNLANIVCDHAGFNFKWAGRIAKYASYVEIDPSLESRVNLGTFVLEDILDNLPTIHVTRDSTDEEKKKYRWIERLKQRISNTLKLIKYGEEYWYCKSDPEEFALKPLTARFHFEPLFNRAGKIILMSATIEPSDLVDIGLATWGELECLKWEGDGIQEWKVDKVHFIKVPNIWPASLRPIYDLHAPRMGSKSTEDDRQKWVKVMADKINSFPECWTGVIHTASKEQAIYIARSLNNLTCRPVYIPQSGMSTEGMYTDWQDFYKEFSGAICVNWAFWEGVDLGDQDFCIVAKVPFPSFADGYDFARHKYDAKASNRRAANRLTQGLGRIRRGVADHYGVNKFVGIADTNYRRVWNYIDGEIKESIR